MAEIVIKNSTVYGYTSVTGSVYCEMKREYTTMQDRASSTILFLME